jgi:hypothetical protein
MVMINIPWQPIVTYVVTISHLLFHILAQWGRDAGQFFQSRTQPLIPGVIGLKPKKTRLIEPFFAFFLKM